MTSSSGEQVLGANAADLIAFANRVLANPDLVEP